MPSTDALSKKLDAITLKTIQASIDFLKKCGVDQNAIAEYLGLRHTQVSVWNTGHRPFSVKNALMFHQLTIAAALSKSLATDEIIAFEAVIKLWETSSQLRKDLAISIKKELGEKRARIEKKSALDSDDKKQQKLIVKEAKRIAIILEQNMIFEAIWHKTRVAFDDALQHIRDEHIKSQISTIDNNSLSTV